VAGGVTHLECGRAGHVVSADGLVNLCHCGSPLLARYDLGAVRESLTKADVAARPPDMWRYRELLPAGPHEPPVTLGEGLSPLLAAPRLGARAGLSRLLIKDESGLPTGSFKARGMSTAVTMARHRGARALAVPSAGNAGCAAAAYGARAGLPVEVFVPADTPAPFVAQARALGARVTLVPGVLTDAARALGETAKGKGWFDLSTLKEPYRAEGKKTMGFEIVEQLGWTYPDALVYPTGGGTGIVGMWKAFGELEALGWVTGRRPRIYSVQAAGCAPIVDAFDAGATAAEPIADAKTFASGLRVPRAIGDFLILSAVRESGGRAIRVTDDDIHDAWSEIGAAEGLFAAPEGAAAWAGLRALVRKGSVGRDETVVLFNTGTGLSYADSFRGSNRGTS
jgi:threonine synthase